MKKLCYLIKITFQTKFAYIKAFWFNIFGTAVSILIYYFLWKYVFQSRDELHGFTASQITTYVILSRLLSSQFSGGINREFAEWVQRGDIVVELLRPVPLVFTLFGKRVGEFLFFFLFKGIPVTILASLILGGIGPDSAANLILFFTSVLIFILIPSASLYHNFFHCKAVECHRSGSKKSHPNDLKSQKRKRLCHCIFSKINLNRH